MWPFLTSQTIFARDFRVLSRTPSWCFGLVFEAVTGHIWFIFPEKQQMTERAELSFSSFSSVWICDDRNAGQVLSRFMLLLLRPWSNPSETASEESPSLVMPWHKNAWMQQSEALPVSSGMRSNIIKSLLPLFLCLMSKSVLTSSLRKSEHPVHSSRVHLHLYRLDKMRKCYLSVIIKQKARGFRMKSFSLHLLLIFIS